MFSVPHPLLLDNDPSFGAVMDSQVDYSEFDGSWRPVPGWAQYLIRIGYEWPSQVDRPRRIAIIAMPCESVGAGLVALGALIRDLTNSTADDLGGHYQAVVRYARQYLEKYLSCEIRCEPKMAGCGFAEEASGFLRDKGDRMWRISRGSDVNAGKFLVERTRARSERVSMRLDSSRWLNPRFATDWQIDGQARPLIDGVATALSSSVYSALIPDARILSRNLERSFSGLCLAGKVAGEAVSRNQYSGVRFRTSDVELSLSALLTVENWNPDRPASRLTYFNARTQTLDRGSYPPSLVVTDGDRSFLKVVTNRQFQRSDVVAIMSRAVDRENLEALGNQLNSLLQWYEPDTDMTNRTENRQRGISMAVLKERVN